MEHLSKQGVSDEALEFAREVDDPNYRDRALGQVAVGFAKAGNDDKASALIAGLVNQEALARTMAVLAVHYKKTGHPDLASKMLAKTFEALRFVKGSRDEDWTKTDITKLFAEAGGLSMAQRGRIATEAQRHGEVGFLPNSRHPVGSPRPPTESTMRTLMPAYSSETVIVTVIESGYSH